MICWGLPRNANVPVCTEVTPAGEKVFELSFTNTSLQSYRAFRFPYPSTAQTIEFTVPDIYGRPWADVWERYFENGMERAGRESLFGFQ